MTHFAKIDHHNQVIEVIAADPAFIDSGAVGDPAQWIQTCSRTRGGRHLDGGTPLRKNYAAIGDTYRPDIDAFVPPQPYPDWQLDPETGLWSAPEPYPQDGAGYRWDTLTGTWSLVIPLGG